MSMHNRSYGVAILGLGAALAFAGPTSGTAQQQQLPPLFDLVEDLRIVSNDAVPQMSLTQVTGLTVLADGSIVTAHSSEFLIRVFNPNGRLALAFGRRGEGPGELQSIMRLGSVGDSIWADDFRSRNFHVFSRSGQFVGDVPYPPRAQTASRGAGPSTSRFIVGLLTGRRTLEYESHRRAAAYAGGIGVADSTLFFVKDAVRGTETRILRTGLSEHPSIRITGLLNTTIGQPLDGRVDAFVAPGGGSFVLASDPATWGGQPGQLRLTELGTNATVNNRTVSLPPIRVTRTFADSFARAVVGMHENRPSPSQPSPRPALTPAEVATFTQEVRSKLFLPEYIPVNKQTMLGRDGTVWMNYRTDGESWTVLADGRMAMRVRVPTGLWVRQVSRDHVWGTITDADGLPIILRYRVVRRG